MAVREVGNVDEFVILRPTPAQVPRHLAFVLDGNRRWARKRGFSNVGDGHRIGFDKIPQVLTWCEEFGIEVVTLWMLSDDNIRNRSAAELSNLYAIDEDVISRITAARGWRLHHIGDKDLLPSPLASLLYASEEATSSLGGMVVNLAIGYGGRSDLVAAVQALVKDIAEGTAMTVTEEVLAGYLSTAGQPDPDLVIRPAGETRTSGFLLWQAALAEYYYCDRLWPDFSHADLVDALHSYSRRQRRLGA